MAIGLYMDVHVPQAITDQLRICPFDDNPAAQWHALSRRRRLGAKRSRSLTSMASPEELKSIHHREHREEYTGAEASSWGAGSRHEPNL